MSTVKEIINGFLARVNLPQHSSYVGATGPAQLQYLALLKMIGDNLRNRPYNWPQLKRSHTFTTVATENKLLLPGDFYRMLESTQWDVTNNWPLRGPTSDYERSVRHFSVTSLQTRKSHRILGPTQFISSVAPWTKRASGYLEIEPAAENSTDQLYMEYISCNWVWPIDWVTNTLYAANSIRTGIGQMYHTAAGGTSGATRPNWQTGSGTDGTVTWVVYAEPFPIATDNDLVLFDDDLMIEGLVWAYLKSKNQDFSQARTDWESMVKNAVSRFEPYDRISACDQMGDADGFPNMPDGSWSV